MSDPKLDDELTVREEPPAANLDKMSLDTTAQAVLPWELRKKAELQKQQREQPTVIGTKVPVAPPPSEKRGSLWGPIGIAYALVALGGSGYLYFRGTAKSAAVPAQVTLSTSTPATSASIKIRPDGVGR